MQLTASRSLDAGERDAVRALARAVEAEDGAPPLSDQALAQLSGPADHVLARDGGEVVGYAQVADGSLELTGAVPALLPLLDEVSTPPVSVWAHGARSRLLPVLAERGYRQTRGLLQLRRPLEPVTPRPVPDDVRIAPFEVGRDEDAWIAVNAAAFADHPEQGRWTRTDVLAREDEPWFDADGFLLAWQGETLIGYHWTKQHSPDLGEVYVLGIAPSAQGTGLGGALLDRGLAHLHERGCTEVLLYVEEDNQVARRLYASRGFTDYDRDTQFTSP